MSNIDLIKTLVTRFDRNLDAYRSGQYNETQVRLEFIDPFFKALGWDVHNEAGIAEAYKDVVHEAKVKVGGATKAPDYSFRVGGTRKYFVEAKKPSVNIAHDTHPSYQLRRYAWSAKLPLSILTDFEEFAVYDCRIKPLKTDKAATARVMYLNFREFEERWNEIADIFSRDAVWKGDFDRFVESKRKKRGTAEVDSAFLKEIENWRELLARNIALRNPELTVYEMNFAVQRTIDRIIFLRICEDRSIERYGQLREQLIGDGIYSKLCRQFKRADERFNSGLFHFKKERDREGTPDTLTLNLAIDDKPLKDIITHLYYPDCPYEFSVLPTEILGHVYEQFLGKVIRLTTAHRAKVEEKPEVRKAGGVYYTPTYIVDYIVKNTVGKLLADGIVTSSRGAGDKGKEVKPKEVSEMKIVDPACGSGSFLIGAYQYLLDWHRDYYIKKGPGRFKDKIQPVTGGDWRLTTPEKKRILLNNIYGVDIDPQAVEVTKLSLLLKVLEGESEETIESQLKFFHERALPDLRQNIKCGNSLIGPDFYESEQMSLLDEEEKYRINAFDWEAEFPEVFSDRKKDLQGSQNLEGRRKGGFDVVIGNPPWIDIKGLPRTDVEYFFKRYRSTSNRINVFAVFTEKALGLLGINGRFGFIIPNSIISQSSYHKLRRIILSDFHIDSVIRMPDRVFQGVIAESAIMVIKKGRDNSKTTSVVFNPKLKLSTIDFERADIVKKIDSTRWHSLEYNYFNIFSDENDIRVCEKILHSSLPLEDFCQFSLGITPYDKYKGHSERQIKEKVFHSNKRLSNEYRKLLDGGDISRYRLKWNGHKWLKYGRWLGAKRQPQFFEGERILVRQIVSGDPLRIYSTLTKENYVNTQPIFNIISKEDSVIQLKYILGILNSQLMNFNHTHVYLDQSKSTFQKILIQNARRFPIRTINFSDSTDKSRHNKMVKLVDRMFDLHKQLSKAKTPHDREVLQRQIDATDRQIDQLVYELYELTEEEVSLIEGTADK